MGTSVMIALLLLALTIVLLLSCRLTLSTRVRRRAARIPRAHVSKDVPVVFVPGLLGTNLVDPVYDDAAIWGGYRGTFMYRSKYEDLDLPLNGAGSNRLQAKETLWNFPLVPGLYDVPVYEELAQSLEAMGYERLANGNPERLRTVVGLCHDWRHGLVAGARALEQTVEQLLDMGASRIHMIGHSWGSMIIRYYLRYGGVDIEDVHAGRTRPGAKHIGTFFAAGAPFAGTPRAIYEIENGFSPGGIIGRPVMPHHVASCPSSYQLLPFGEDSIVDMEGNVSSCSLRDPDVWRDMAWGPWRPASFSALAARSVPRNGAAAESMHDTVDSFLKRVLPRARSLWELMQVPNVMDRQVRTVTYASDNKPTLSRPVLNGKQLLSTAEEVRRLAPHLYERLVIPGDSYVTLEQTLRVCGDSEVIREPTRVPEGSYTCLIDAPSHRDLLKQDSLLTNLLMNICREN